MIVFTAFAVIYSLMLYRFFCVRCFFAVAFVRFTVAKLMLLAAGKGFRSLRRATGALPLDPAAFEKAGETFSFGFFANKKINGGICHRSSYIGVATISVHAG